MIHIRRSDERGHTVWDWLDSYHVFSFGEYYDPQNRGFRKLRVINDDRIAPGKGFAAHEHQDMEILSFAIEGKLQHEDSLGNGSVIKPGEIQIMSAGTGIRHSEFNASNTESAHFLQIWIYPERKGMPPRYDQHPIHFTDHPLTLIASPDGREQSVVIHQNVEVYHADMMHDSSLQYTIDPRRHLWIYVYEGGLKVGNDELNTGDSLSCSEEYSLDLAANPTGKCLIFDLD